MGKNVIQETAGTTSYMMTIWCDRQFCQERAAAFEQIRGFCAARLLGLGWRAHRGKHLCPRHAKLQAEKTAGKFPKAFANSRR